MSGLGSATPRSRAPGGVSLAGYETQGRVPAQPARDDLLSGFNLVDTPSRAESHHMATGSTPTEPRMSTTVEEEAE